MYLIITWLFKHSYIFFFKSRSIYKIFFFYICQAILIKFFPAALDGIFNTFRNFADNLEFWDPLKFNRSNFTIKLGFSRYFVCKLKLKRLCNSWLSKHGVNYIKRRSKIKWLLRRRKPTVDYALFLPWVRLNFDARFIVQILIKNIQSN